MLQQLAEHSANHKQLVNDRCELFIIDRAKMLGVHGNKRKFS